MNDKLYNKNLLNALIRQDFASFIIKSFHTINPNVSYKHSWHIDLISDYLEAVRKFDIKRLIINLPPRSLKSICTSVAWPAWILANDPNKRILVSSYNSALSIKHSLDCRFILQSDWYKSLFPKSALNIQHNRKDKFLTTSNGFRFATSIGSSVIGEGGDYLIIDDPHNPTQIYSHKLRKKTIDWFEQSFMTRLNSLEHGAVVLVMQRLHIDDMSGHLLSSGNWELLNIPVVAPRNIKYQINNNEYNYYEGDVLHKERNKIDMLNELEQQIGSKNYLAQYMQSPVVENYNLLSTQDVAYYETTPDKFEFYVQSWDTAIKTSEHSDYSVCTSWGVLDNRYYLISVFKEKMTYPTLKSTVEKYAQKYMPAHILIEDKASGQSIIQDLQLLNYKNIVPIKPIQDKVTRFASVVPMFQSGIVLFPARSGINKTLISELTEFPNSKHDDIVDSVSQFLNFMKNNRSATQVAPRIRTI